MFVKLLGFNAYEFYYLCVSIHFRVVFSSQARTPLSVASPSTSRALVSYFITSLINIGDYLFILQEILVSLGMDLTWA
jgi:hypothetical protein